MDKIRADEEKLKSLRKLKKTSFKGREEKKIVTEVDGSGIVAQPGEMVGQGSSELVEKVISIKRVTKVTKGGKKLAFSALVVVGDTKGKVGYHLAKAKEVSIAIRKAVAGAKKSLVAVALRGTTITHEVIGGCGASRVLLKPAAPGTGVIAAGPVRAVCDGAGIRDILSKCHRSNNSINVVKATFDGLSRLKPFSVSSSDQPQEGVQEAAPIAPVG